MCNTRNIKDTCEDTVNNAESLLDMYDDMEEKLKEMAKTKNIRMLANDLGEKKEELEKDYYKTYNRFYKKEFETKYNEIVELGTKSNIDTETIIKIYSNSKDCTEVYREVKMNE